MASQSKTTSTNTSKSRLILEDVQIWRENTTILRGINWQIKPGEHWAILGPNGSGKTSLIMAISGYLPFGRGRIYLLDGWIGRINLPEQRKRIGIVSQSLSEHIARTTPQSSVIDVILTGLFASLRLVDEVTEEERERAMEILNQLGHGDLATTQFSLLATGERQACVLARSKMAQSELVLLDEACAGLDLGARERFLSSLDSMIKSADCPTTIFVTHHPEEIVSGITHVLLMHEGSVVAAGPKKEVLTSALLSQTFDFPLRVTADNGRYWVQAAHSEPVKK